MEPDIPEEDEEETCEPRRHVLVVDPRMSRFSAQARRYSLAEGPFKKGRRAREEKSSDENRRTDEDPHSARLRAMAKTRRMSVAPRLLDVDPNDFFSGGQRRVIDRTPHPLFVQLNELTDNNDEKEWRQTARWIKYEEDVEEGSERFGKAHVASLSFHSLLNLRRCIQLGVLMLDLNEKDMAGVAFRIAEQMSIDDLIDEDDKSLVMRCLLLKHKHVNEQDRSFRLNIRRNSTYSSLQWPWGRERFEGRRKTVANLMERNNSIKSQSSQEEKPKIGHPILNRRHTTDIISLSDVEKGKLQVIPLKARDTEDVFKTEYNRRKSLAISEEDMKEETYTSQEDVKKVSEDSILRRIPEGSEACATLVGQVTFLTSPTVAFVRLAQGVVLPSVLEANIPVRFVFVLLGPPNSELDYHEIGRSISTLMSAKSFYETAYRAENRQEFLSGINEFLDDSIVLPPGDWDNEGVLQFNELKLKSDKIRRRKKDALDKTRRMSEKVESKEVLLTMDGEKKTYKAESPLERTGRLFGGFFNDVKRRYPHYLSDITDGLNGQCIAAAIFMYFAALSSAITFGGLVGDKTNNLMGISETLISTAFTGILFALLSGQPMMVVGTTGPLLLFDESLYKMCISNNIDYLTMRVYLGFWLAIIATVVAMFEGSVLVKKFTRFTEDIFSSLISLIFIMEAVSKLLFVYTKHPLLSNYCLDTIAALTGFDYPVADLSSTDYPVANGNFTDELMQADMSINSTDFGDLRNSSDIPSNLMGPKFKVEVESQPNTALFSTVLTVCTFLIAYYLRILKSSKFFGRLVRRMVGDFGVPIAIILMVLMDYMMSQTYTEKLNVPEGLSPSDPSVRGWIISLNGREGTEFPIWAAFAALVPALMVYIITFMETHIAELIVDKPERNLKKGSGFHMDIVIISYLNILCGLVGAPFVCVATVRSVSHVSALTIMSTDHAPGEKPYIKEVKEQRLSALLVSLLVGVSVLLASVLRLVPLSVLFGVFLYMGISSMNGIQLFERVILFFRPVKHYPPVPYVKKVKPMKMHLFTIIQLLCLALLWIVKSSKASLAFPFLLIMMVPLRGQLSRIFTHKELRALDGKNQDFEDDEPEGESTPQ